MERGGERPPPPMCNDFISSAEKSTRPKWRHMGGVEKDGEPRSLEKNKTTCVLCTYSERVSQEMAT